MLIRFNFTVTGSLGFPISPHSSVWIIKVHILAVEDRFKSEQVTWVELVVLGQVPQLNITWYLTASQFGPSESQRNISIPSCTLANRTLEGGEIGAVGWSNTNTLSRVYYTAVFIPECPLQASAYVRVCIHVLNFEGYRNSLHTNACN